MVVTDVQSSLNTQATKVARYKVARGDSSRVDSRLRHLGSLCSRVKALWPGIACIMPGGLSAGHRPHVLVIKDLKYSGRVTSDF